MDTVAAVMDRVRELPDAQIDYELLADAIVWSDEYPSPDEVEEMYEFQCIKILLRYRTSVLLGRPDDTFQPYWDHARRLFPNWAGFTPARLVPSDELKAFYERRSKRDLRRLEKILRCESAQNEERRPSQ